MNGGNSQDTLESGTQEANASPAPLNPTRLEVSDAVRAIRAAASTQVTVELMRAYIEAGAPANADETINVIHYAAWMIPVTTSDNQNGVPNGG